MNVAQQNSTSVLCWPKRLLSADDLRRHLTSQRELVLLPRTIVTPLALDELRAKGVRVSWHVPKPAESTTVRQDKWSYAQEKPHALVASAIQALERDGITLTALEFAPSLRDGARTTATAILNKGYQGAVVFCSDPALVCCIANKIAGLRAVAVGNTAEVVRTKKSLGPNLFAIEMPGRTFFEIRHMLKTIVTRDSPCPAEIAKSLQEVDGHAHR